jgi:mannose-1-phosphate guanylyltransferase
MKAVILAGGKGTRLRPLTYTKAKPMIPFLNKPVAEHIIEKISKQGFKEILITTNYLVGQIRDYFGDGSKWGVKVRTIEEDRPLGTAGSVKNALDHLDETFAVIQGDNISEIDVGRLYKEHKRMGGLLTISLMEVQDVSLFGVAEMDGDEITAYKEKPLPTEVFSNLANDGIYIVEPEVLDMIPLEFYDFSRNLFPKMLAEGKKICGSVTHDFWRDVGTPKDYLEATHYLLRGQNLITKGSKVDESKVSESVIGDDCSVKGSRIASSVLFDNVRVGAGSRLKDCIVGSNCAIGKNVDIWPGAVIGDDVVIGDNVVVMDDTQIGPKVSIPSNQQIEGRVIPSDVDAGE